MVHDKHLQASAAGQVIKVNGRTNPNTFLDPTVEIKIVRGLRPLDATLTAVKGTILLESAIFQGTSYSNTLVCYERQFCFKGEIAPPRSSRMQRQRLSLLRKPSLHVHSPTLSKHSSVEEAKELSGCVATILR